MKEKQRRIFDWLQQVSPELAELYEGAVMILEEDNFPGGGRFICHAVREIRNRLTDAVLGRIDVENINYRYEVEGLAIVWENAGLGGVYEKYGKNEDLPLGQKITKEVSVRIEQLLEKHKRVAYTNREKMMMLLVELEPENKTLQGSLSPVVDVLFRETEWFADRTHVGKEISKSDLAEHFQLYEQALYNIIGFFFEGMDDIERMTKTANELMRPPSDEEVNTMILRLSRARYWTYFFDKLENPHWLIPLQKKGFFNSPKEMGEEYERWPQGRYLKRMASKMPTEVLDIIVKIKSKNPFVQNECFECLLEMSEGVASKGVGVVRNFIGERRYSGHFGWSWGGKQSAELMVKLINKHAMKSFEIARLLLDIWRPGEKEAGFFERIRSKFVTHDYKELIFNYYSKVWEKCPFEAICILIDIYDKYLDECFEAKNYDVSEYLGISLRDLEDDYHLDSDIEAILVKALYEAGRMVVEKEPDKVTELSDNLEKRNKGVFHRVEMYLLRFVQAGAESGRINKIIANQKFIESPFYKYEHRHLLNEKFDEVSKETREKFIEWVSQPKITEEKKEEVRQWCQNNNKELPDFEKRENQKKAEELYLVREREGFKELYDGYKTKSGLTDSALSPRPIFTSKTEFVSPEEGSPYSSEKMGKDNVLDVVNYLLEPENYEGAEKVSGWGTAKEALASSLKFDVKKRPLEYINLDLKKLLFLDHEFLEKLFYGFSETVRDGSFKKDSWERLIDLACEIVRTKNKNREWKECFLAILCVLHDGFGEESNRITFNETIIRQLWLILKEMVRYSYDEISESEEDPFQRRLSSVQGRSFGQLISLGIVSKSNFASLYENFLKEEMRQVYGFIAKEVKRSEVNCTFGSDLARIYWLDKEWMESNVDNIFSEELWDSVWGTYVSWGRPSTLCFKFLIEASIYVRAVERIGEGNKYQFRKKPDEGLMEHLMIGYFNGWINFESDVLKVFFDKASADLRGKAARFLTTGFKSVNEEGVKEKDEVAERMRKYWNGRLAAIEEKTEENQKEAIELTGWVENSVLPAKETLELLEKTLNLSGGKIGELRDAKEFIEGICKIGEGNELLALRCLKKASGDKNMHAPWSMIHEPLVKFLEGLPEEARSEGKEVADLYGRYNPDKFRKVWDKLTHRG